ncbi:MAG: hypothetical protein IJ659_04675 [Alloprevotella sp.]|nr:hypothetical protein [Alloprevotella sp.]
MKKLLLLTSLFLATAAMRAGVAQDAAGEYGGKLYISIMSPIDDSTEALDNQSISIEAQSENTVRFSLVNFNLGEGMQLGDIILENVPVSKASNGILFGKNDPVELSFLDGALLAKASINSSTSLIDGKSASIDVDVVWVQEEGSDIPIYVRFVGEKKTFQVPNSDFESWAHNNEPGNGWYSFHSAGGSQASTGKSLSEGLTTKVTGSDAYQGGTSVQIESKWVGVLFFGANANGNLTTGRVNMGSMTPADAANHNYTERSSANSCRFEGRPDSVAYYATYKRGGSGSYRGRLHAVLHGDLDYKDPSETDANKAKFFMAEATVYADVTDKWTRFCGAFNYTDVESDKAYMLASFTTNETPGGSTGDVFRIDNVEFIYNSELASCVYDGKKITVQNGKADLGTQEYDAEKLQLTANGRAATIQTAYDEETGVLTVTVRGQNAAENPANVHVYALQFKKIETGIEEIQHNNVRPATGSYDLQGRRTLPTSRGLYIIGGKKILF